MERLTKRMGGIEYSMCGNLIIAKCENCNNRKPSCYEEDCRTELETLHKLAAYEDLEEQGRLIALPCKIGDTVYGPLGDKVQEYKVFRFEIGLNITIVLEMPMFNTTFGVLDRAFGKTVFLTKEAAEAALKESEE